MAWLPGDRPAANIRSTRSVVMARNGMIATSQPLASAAGLRVLQAGGNAIDAAVTAAAVLGVVEPSMTGIGGDLFAIVYNAKTKTLHGLNASGRSPRAATPEAFAARGLTSIPLAGPLSVTVPGVVDGWSQLLTAYGTATLAQALAPAIGYAKDGYPVSEIVSGQWKGSEQKLAADPFAASTFLQGGHAPAPGDIVANRPLAATLGLIASGGRDAFYRGPIAAAIAADMKRRDGLLDAGDLADHRSDWVVPITTNYRGYDVYELPPNTQGFVVLEMLNILEGFDVKAMGYNSPEYLHAFIETKRIAFADRAAYLGDADGIAPSVLKMLISKEYAARRRKEIDLSRAAAQYVPGDNARITSQARGDTIYMTTADGQGNMVSLIQSIFADFGSGIVAGDTGIVLHNRGSLFNLTPGSANVIAPRKRPPHTLIPAFVMKDGRPWLSFGVMGADHQTQGQVQVVANLVDFGMNVQEAGEAARVNHAGDSVSLESAIPAATRAGLEQRGHRVANVAGVYGGYQGIMVDQKTGVLMGGSDVRKDGLAIGY